MTLLTVLSFGQERIDRLDSLFSDYRLYQVEDSPFGIPEVAKDSFMVKLYPVHKYDGSKPELYVNTYSGPSIDLTDPLVRNSGVASLAGIGNTGQGKGRHYLTTKPLTSLSLRIGTGGEQNFEMFHTQNISRTWNVAGGFNRVNQEGFYENQKVLHDRLWLSSIYVSDGGVYQGFFDVDYDNMTLGQNGGIVSDSAFNDRLLEDKKLIDVMSSQGGSARRKWSISYRQYLNIGVNKDTSGYYEGIKGGRFEHSISWSRGRRIFDESDPELSHYPQVLLSSEQTRDSVVHRVLNNEIGWRGIHVDGFSYYIGSGHDWRRYGYQPSDSIRLDSFMSSYYVRFDLDYVKGRVSADASGRYNMVGFNEKGYWLDIDLRVDSIPFIFDRFTASLSTERSLWDPSYYQYSSNHYQWDQDWSQTGESTIQGEFLSTKKGFRVSAKYSLLQDWYYFDQTARPRKFEGLIDVFTARAVAPVELGRFEIIPQLWYHSTSNSIIPIPELVLKGDLVWKTGLFKGKMETRFGVSAMWISEYSGYGYSPVSGQFYLQGEREIGNYPYLEFYVDGKVKEVRFFVKVSHLNAGIMGTYYAALNYPMPDRAIKFGLTWPFLN